MKRLFFIACLILGFITVAHSGDFVYSAVDYLSGTGEIVIAPARNDSINRLYATGFGLYEYTWQDSAWQKVTIQAGSGSPNVLAAGFGRNDGVWRLYGGVSGKNLYEYSYEGGVWNASLVEGVIDVGGSVELGDIKNDDTIRVVAGGSDYVTMAYTYQSAGNTWRAETLGVNVDEIHGVAIGCARNDDTNRAFTGGVNTDLIEYWYSNDHWEQNIIANGFVNSIIGFGRDDTINRLYLNGIVECTWALDHWVYGPMDTNAQSYSGQAVVADGRNDGINRVYVAGRGLGGPADSVSYYVYVLEKSYDSLMGWTRKEIKALTYSAFNPMWWVTVGDARNDNINRIYGIIYSGQLFEFTWVDTLNGVAAEPVTSDRVFSLQLNQNYPNPFNQATVISYQATGEGPVSLSVYNITGQLVRTLVNETSPSCPSPNAFGEGRVRWDGRDDNGRAVPNGVYIYKLNAGGKSISRKMIIIR